MAASPCVSSGAPGGFAFRVRELLPRVALALGTALALAACGNSSPPPTPEPPAPPEARAPNILFVIMDDVGIDQMKVFGYGGATPPSMPNIDAVALAGIRFRNTWSMPECSPGRASFFVGRYPFRTGMYQALGPNDLANAQLTPHDVTVPKLLKPANYESAMFGKFHLAGPENNEAGNATPAQLGWDHFHGWIGGLPGSIDTTAGGLAPPKTHVCGFVPGAAAGGADAGACHFADRTCTPMASRSPFDDAPGLRCVDAGGLFVPGQACGAPPPSLDFERLNAYYVSPLVIIDGGEVEEVPLTDPRARGYRTRIETDAAIDWIKTRSGSQRPWMATVSYSAPHTPFQQPPRELIPTSWTPASDALACNGTVPGRVLQNQMTEALDTEFGRLLVETGLATRDAQGKLVYDPKATNTVIVIVGDNGTLGFAVKQPFNAELAKGTAYQTGIWDPLIVAGPQVEAPGREVEHMVNMVDLFQFFGELAGVDAHAAVPRTIDSVGLLPYLKSPDQPSLRTINFSMGGFNAQANGGRNAPCIINATSCSQVPISKGVCEDNQGIWWGPGYDDPSVVANGGAGYASCCQVNQALQKNGLDPVNILPEISTAIRDERFKLVRNITQAYDSATDSCGTFTSEELFEIDQAVPEPLLDDPERNLLVRPTPEALQIHAALQAKLDAMLASEPDCPGDGNRDGVVDAADLSNWQRIASEWGLSSVYDFLIGGVHDGLTNQADGDIVTRNQGLACGKGQALY